MRDIRFRGKRVDNGEWVYGYYGVLGAKTDNERHIILTWDFAKDATYPYFYFVDNEVLPETVGQFTGLHDKNGVEIYEGDVVIYEEPTEPITSYTVEFTDYLGRWSGLDENGDNPMLACFNTFCEVIGNIHNQEGNDE